MRPTRQSGRADAAEGIRSALTMLASDRLRSGLTTLGMVIGVMTVIAILAVVEGLDRTFKSMLDELGAQTVYVDKWNWLTLAGDWWTFRNRQPIGLPELRAIDREARHAVAAVPMAHAPSVTISRGGRQEAVNVTGTNSQFLKTGNGNVGAGRFLVEADVELSRPAIVIGATTAERLFPGIGTEAVVGQRVLLLGHSFTVVGVLEARGRMLGVDMDGEVHIPYTAFGRLFGSKRNMTIGVVARPGELMALEDEITSILRRVRKVPPGKPDDFTLNRQEEFLKLYHRLTSSLYGVAVGMGLITLLVGGIGIMNIMLVSVTERTREIGLRRALGARRSSIMFQFLVEAAFVSALGGAVGIALGFGIAKAIAAATALPAAASWMAVFLGLGFSASVGLLFGSWPAWRAAHLDPAEALRFE